MNLSAALTLPAIESELAALNKEFSWPRDVEVRIEDCGEANAFYDLGDQSITICHELEAWLSDVSKELELN